MHASSPVFASADDYAPFTQGPLSPASRRAILHRTTDVLVDVGANVGQYAQWARRLAYRGRIVSFEPAVEAFRQPDSQPFAVTCCGSCGSLAQGGDAGLSTAHTSRLRSTWATEQ